MARQKAAAAGGGEFRGIFISEAEVEGLLGLPPLLSSLTGPASDMGFPDSVHTGRLGRLAERCRLSDFECACLLLALAPHLDRRYGRLYAYLQDDLTKPYPTADLAFTLFCTTFAEKVRQRSRFGAWAPLRQSGLLSLDGNDAQPLITRPLAVDERLVAYLLGRDDVDPGITEAGGRLEAGLAPEIVLPPAVRDEMSELQRRWAAELDAGELAPVLCVVGPPGSGRRLAARHLAAAVGRPLLCLSHVPALPGWRAPREALLQDAVLCVADADALFEGLEVAAAAWLNALGGAVAAARVPLIFTLANADRLPATFAGREMRLLRLPAAGVEERARIWMLEARGVGLGLSGDQSRLLATTYRLTGAQVRDAVGRARLLGGSRRPQAQLVNAARALSTVSLGRLGQEVAPRFAWGDIVVPAEVADALQEIIRRVRHHPRVFGEWGFDRRHAPSRSLSVLFSGPSGTGKTMAAEVIASELGLPLYRVDLSAVVSKYIGETEKNLSQIFADASSSGAILFFDEADALFGKRSEVRDSHDRYANMEVSYLLQRMEDYDGIVVLASNLRQNMDEAFVRRLHLAVDFPFPDAEARLEIWRRTLPALVPLAEDVDLPFLARRFRLSGGNIRNVVVTAAFLAAPDGSAVSMHHFLSAIRREHQKMGKLLMATDDDILPVPSQNGAEA